MLISVLLRQDGLMMNDLVLSEECRTFRVVVALPASIHISSGLAIKTEAYIASAIAEKVVMSAQTRSLTVHIGLMS